MIQGQEHMTWHDKSAGGYTKRPDLHPHTAVTVKGGTTSMRGEHVTYSVVRDDDGNNPCQASAHMKHFPIGSINLIQQILLPNTNVCSHAKQGCVLASLDHLGIYGFILPIQSPEYSLGSSNMQTPPSSNIRSRRNT
eukprot:3682330-Amphidinium_carterae.1